MKCRICGNADNNKSYLLREMMFGWKDEFGYFQCSRCECLQITSFPADIGRYYPSNYYSFSLPAPDNRKIPLRRKIQLARYKFAYFGHGQLGRWIRSRFLSNKKHQSLSRILPDRGARILDVGCGSGPFLRELQELGFNNLLGIDPYLDRDIRCEKGLTVLKKSIHEVNGKFDVVMFHHSFEHAADPLETLRSAAKLLSDQGVCLIRIPTVSSYAWETYRENWVQLDAPRHFFLHSTKSIDILAQQCGLYLAHHYHDASNMQFWGSEQYQQDISLQSPQSYGRNKRHSIFTKSDLRNFDKMTKKLNLENHGDQACFYLTKTTEAPLRHDFR